MLGSDWVPVKEEVLVPNWVSRWAQVWERELARRSYWATRWVDPWMSRSCWISIVDHGLVRESVSNERNLLLVCVVVVGERHVSFGNSKQNKIQSWAKLVQQQGKATVAHKMKHVDLNSSWSSFAFLLKQVTLWIKPCGDSKKWGDAANAGSIDTCCCCSCWAYTKSLLCFVSSSKPGLSWNSNNLLYSTSQGGIVNGMDLSVGL